MTTCPDLLYIIFLEDFKEARHKGNKTQAFTISDFRIKINKDARRKGINLS